MCQSNFDQVVSRAFLEDMASRGVQYAWYYIYRPVGPNPTPELCLRPEQIRELREFLVDSRTWAPIIVVDTYWDADGTVSPQLMSPDTASSMGLISMLTTAFSSPDRKVNYW